MSPYTTRCSGGGRGENRKGLAPTCICFSPDFWFFSYCSLSLLLLAGEVYPLLIYTPRCFVRARDNALVVCLSKYVTPSSQEETRQTQNEDYSTKLPAVICKNVKVKKRKERIRNCSRLMEIKETRYRNWICGPRLDAGLERGGWKKKKRLDI